MAGLEGGYRVWLYRAERANPYPPDRFEIYVIGESSAVGAPYAPRVSFPILIEKMYGGMLGGRRIVVRNLARHGDSIYPRALALRDSANFRDRRIPGVLLIYSGHNEAFDTSSQGRLSRVYQVFKESLAIRSFLLSDALCAVERRFGWRGHRSPASYEFYLRHTVESALAGGLTPILSTVVSNVSDLEPGVKLDGLPESFPATHRQGMRLEEEGRWEEALRLYRASPLRDRFGAYLEYRAARCLEGLGREDEARAGYWRAIDQETSVSIGRANTAQNGIIAELAREYGGGFLDAVALFEKSSPRGLVGRELFVDGNHPNLDGYALLARGFAMEIARVSGAQPLHPSPISSDARSWCGVDRGFESRAHASAGGWLVNVSAGLYAPRERLGLARANFERAVELDAFNLQAWIGLATVEALDAGALSLENREDLEWLRRYNVLFTDFFCAKSEDIPHIRDGFEGRGVSRRVLAGISKSLLAADFEELCPRR